MPQVEVDGLTINYDVQGEGEPLLLIPYTSADHACWAFQLPAYTEHFSCIAIDLPGSGESDKPPGPYSTDGHADQVAAFLGAIGIERAHVAGMSFGAAVGMHLAARHPGRVRSLSLHSGWHASDDYLKIVVEQWRTLARTLPTVADVVIQAHLPVVLHARHVRRTAGVRRHAGGLRAWPPRPARGRVPGPDRRGHRPRRQRGTGRHRRSDPDHLRSARPRLLHALRRTAQRAGSPGASWWSSITSRTPGCTRTPKPSTARRSTSCCDGARDAHAGDAAANHNPRKTSLISNLSQRRVCHGGASCKASSQKGSPSAFWRSAW